MLTLAFALAFTVAALAALPRNRKPVGVLDGPDVVTVPDSGTDLPCPWCLTPTNEDDTSCPGCDQTFGATSRPQA